MRYYRATRIYDTHFMASHIIQTDRAPQVIGTCSQAVHARNGYQPRDIGGRAERPDRTGVAQPASRCSRRWGEPAKRGEDHWFLTDMAAFAQVNEVMARHFPQPYPARAAVGAASLPRGALVEVEAVLVLDA